MKVYAAWNPSAVQRQGSASGGVATMLARAVLEVGGVYFGTRWDEQMRPVVAWTETDVTPFKGSRYVHSRFDAAAREQLERFLTEGRTVLFVGTPCQVAALQALREHPRLICVDLICHGTVPASYLEQELSCVPSPGCTFSLFVCLSVQSEFTGGMLSLPVCASRTSGGYHPGRFYRLSEAGRFLCDDPYAERGGVA